MGDEPVNLNARRVAANPRPDAHAPRIALYLALADIEKLKPDHVIVIMGQGGHSTTYYQTGKYTRHEMIGLLDDARHIIRKGPKNE